jgi:hypothetical protein
LEALTPNGIAFATGEWTFLEQCEGVVEAVKYSRYAGVPYPATDREIALLALLANFEDLLDGYTVGPLHLPSGAVVGLAEADGGDDARLVVRGRVLVKDLPEQVRHHVSRMPPARQPERERQLPILHQQEIEMQRRAEEARRSDRKQSSMP